LSEVEGVMAIEEEFGIKVPWEEMEAEIGKDPTFGQFVDYVVKLASNKSVQGIRAERPRP
jgi:acyl carrier protein